MTFKCNLASCAIGDGVSILNMLDTKDFEPNLFPALHPDCPHEDDVAYVAAPEFKPKIFRIAEYKENGDRQFYWKRII